MREARISMDAADFEALGIERLVELCYDAGITTFEELVCHGTGSVVQVGVEESLDTEQLDSLEYVTDWDRITGSEEDYLYLVAFEAPALSDEITEPMTELMGTCEPEVHDDEATLSLVGDQDVIAETIDNYEADGVRPDLRKLGRYDGPERPLENLTDRQREVIQTAWDSGYFEVPRSITTAELAEELDLDDSTVAEHLQRAERNLLEIHLGET
ncbi:MAG: helix-turn-helix domain-containing protein [Salinirussus sp.]